MDIDEMLAEEEAMEQELAEERLAVAKVRPRSPLWPVACCPLRSPARSLAYPRRQTHADDP